MTDTTEQLKALVLHAFDTGCVFANMIVKFESSNDANVADSVRSRRSGPHFAG
jgi:hypothetical protein